MPCKMTINISTDDVKTIKDLKLEIEKYFDIDSRSLEFAFSGYVEYEDINENRNI